MNILLRPYWIWVFITLPQILLLGFYAHTWWIIRSMLSPEQYWYWADYGGVAVLLFVGNTVYGVVMYLHQRQLSAAYAWTVLATHATFLVLFVNHYSYIIPPSVPSWMMLWGDLGMLTYTLMMPASLYGLLLLMVCHTPVPREIPVWRNFIKALAIPFSWLVLMQIGLPVGMLGNTWVGVVLQNVFGLVVVAMIITFFYFLLRGLWGLLSRKVALRYEMLGSASGANGLIQSAHLVSLMMVCLVIGCPVLGLWLNEQWFNHVFGDFGHYSFFLIAIMNGIALSLPHWEIPLYRLGLWWVRCVGYSYILYFTLVFLPFLPLGVIFILAYGLGFLMLSPLLIAIVQGRLILADVQYLRQYYPSVWLYLVGVLGFLLLPGGVMYHIITARHNLHTALEILQNPDAKPYMVSQAQLESTLLQTNVNRRRRNEFMGMSEGNLGQQPYLSALYRWWVMDNLTLSDERLDLLRRVFLDNDNLASQKIAAAHRKSPANMSASIRDTNTQVRLDSLYAETHYDKDTQTWTTWVHLNMKNPSSTQQEYVAELDLPTGAWVSNYYLQIENRREYGILAERRAAEWVYREIKTVRRDPGILRYVSRNRLSIRVFPFQPEEVRHTGIQFTHREPLVLTIEGRTVQIGKPSEGARQIFVLPQAAYIPAAAKLALPKHTRKPRLHIIADMSARAKREKKYYPALVAQVLQQTGAATQQTRLVLTNAYTQPLALTQKSWEDQLQASPCQGGFYLDNALRQIYLSSLQDQEYYPVVVVISPQDDGAVFGDNFGNWIADERWFQQSIFFLSTKMPYRRYTLSSDRRTLELSESISAKSMQQVFTPRTWRVYAQGTQHYYLPDDAQPELITLDAPAPPYSTLVQRKWQSGLVMHAVQHRLALHPERLTQDWLSLVRMSMHTGFLSMYTAYISLETEAQKQALLAKQKQILGASPLLDSLESQHMSEPNWYWLLGGIALWWGVSHIWKRNGI